MSARHGDGEARSLGALKKRLFIIACNVVTAALLLLYVTYSQYRISIQATVRMPQAGQIYAELTLTPDQSRGASLEGMETFLSDLAPGDDPMAFATSTEGDRDHCFTVEVTNSQTVNGEQVASEVAMDYWLRVYSTGHIPLKMVLAVDKGDDTKEYYVSHKYTPSSADAHKKNIYYFLPKSMENSNLGQASLQKYEKVFSFPANELETHTYEIYCGWDPSDESGDYRKEVEHLEVRAELVSKSGNVDSSWQTNDRIIIYQPKQDPPQGDGT